MCGEVLGKLGQESAKILSCAKAAQSNKEKMLERKEAWLYAICSFLRFKINPMTCLD